MIWSVSKEKGGSSGRQEGGKCRRNRNSGKNNMNASKTQNESYH